MSDQIVRTEQREAKFVFADQSVSDAIFSLLSSGRSIGDFVLTPKRQEVTEDMYWDTAAHTLQRTRASLRLRQRKGMTSVLQFKKPVGDVSVDMGYLTLSWDCQEPSVGSHLPLADEAMTAVLLQAGSADVTPIGTVRTERTVVTVARGDRQVGEIMLDEFGVSRTQAPEYLTGREIEIKGHDPRELLYLGQCLCNWFGLIRVTSSKIERHIPLQSPATRLLLDMDPGVDDALALLYVFAHANRPKVDAITTVGGNVSVRQCAVNAFRLCRWAQSNGLIDRIPEIGTGVDVPGVRSNAANVHGADGLGDIDWGSIDKEAEGYHYIDAIELQRDVLLKNPGEVTIVATGPCSNLGQLILRHPEALAAAREVIIMGGSFFDCGNRGPQSEFNIHSDSGAARMVLDYCRRLIPNGSRSFRERVPLSFVGLDVTHRAILERSAIRGVDGPATNLAASVSSKYMDFYRMVLGVDGCPLHDPLAVGLALRPEYFVREPYHVEVISTSDVSETDGITIADYRPCAVFKDKFKEVTQVCVSINAQAYVADFLNTLETAGEASK